MARIELPIEGMTCDDCVRKVTDALKKVAGVRAVSAKYNLSVTTKGGRINGVITQYAFTGNKGGLIITLTGSSGNPHVALFKTIIKTVKLL